MLVTAVGCGGEDDQADVTVAVDVEKDVSYGSDRYEMFDVYSPSEPGPWPVVIVAHGFSELRSNFKSLSRAIAEKGVIVYNLEYDTGFPAISGIHDVACAVRSIRAALPDYDAIPDRITFVGSSQGAVTGLIVGMAGDEFTADCPAAEGSATVDVFVGYEGPYNWAHGPAVTPELDFPALEQAQPEVWAAVDPYTHIGGNPSLEIHLVHGDDTGVAWYEVPRSTSVDLHAGLGGHR